MNRKFNKLISLTIIFVMLLTNMVSLSTVCAQGDILTEKQMQILDSFGCIGEGIESNSKVTRGQFANLLFKIATPLKSENITPEVVFNDVDKESEYYESVYLLSSLGVILGNGNGNFNPEDTLTSYQAGIMALRLLGYADVIPKNEYGQFIARKSLFKCGLSLDNSEVTYETALKLLYDILYADVTSLYDGYGNVNFMNYMLDLYEISGIITNDGKNTFEGENTQERNHIFINGYAYETKDDYTGWLGYKVYGLVKKDADGYSIYTIKENNYSITKVTSTLLLGYDDYIYTYEDKYNEEKELKLKTNIDTIYVYNGSTVSIDDKFDKKMLKPEIGMITGIDNDGDKVCEVVYIDDYTCGIVSVWDTRSNKIIFKDGKADIKIGELKYSITDFDGNVVETLNENNVVWVGYDLKKENVKIIVGKNYSEGKIHEIDGEYLTLSDGAKYRYASSFDSKKKQEINVGENYILRLDPAGDIAFMEISIDTTYNKTGFLVASKKLGSALDELYAVRIFTESGEMTDFNLNKKNIKIIDEKGGISILSANKAFDKLSSYNEGLISYSTDIYGDINSVTLPYDGSGEDREQLNKIYETVDVASSSNYFENVYYKNNNFGGNAIADSNTKVFYIPEDRNEKRDYRIDKISSLGAGYYLCKIFNFNSKSVMANYVVKYGISSDSVKFGENAYLISGMYEIWDEELEEIRRIIEVGTDRKKYYLRDKDLYKNVPAAIDPSVTRDVEVGDVVRLSISNNEILAMRLIYDANGNDFVGRDGNIAGAKIEQFDITQGNSIKTTDEKSAALKGNPVAIAGTVEITLQASAYKLNVGNEHRYIEGYILSQYGEALTLTTQNLRTNVYNPLWDISKDSSLRVEDGNAYITQSYRLSEFTVIDLDTNDGRTVDVRKATAADVKTYEKYGSECSKAVYVSKYGDLRGAFIYIGRAE